MNEPHYKDFDDHIDLHELFTILLQAKWIITSITLVALIIGVIFSLSLPNIYESKAILAAKKSENIINSSQGLGAYAGLAGISIPSSGSGNNAVKAIQKINSLSFFENNFLPNIYLPDLMAVKSWDSKTNALVYDESIYNTKSDTWSGDYSYQKKQMPSSQEGFIKFKNEHLTISENKKNGFITLSVKHQSPFIARQWADLILTEINSFYRQKDKIESENSYNYLNEQLMMTNISDIKEVLAALIKKEVQKLTLVEANEFYVFEYIDPPAVMENKSEPRRFIICIFSAILGMILSILLAIGRHYFYSSKVV